MQGTITLQTAHINNRRDARLVEKGASLNPPLTHQPRQPGKPMGAQPDSTETKQLQSNKTELHIGIHQSDPGDLTPRQYTMKQNK